MCEAAHTILELSATNLQPFPQRAPLPKPASTPWFLLKSLIGQKADTAGGGRVPGVDCPGRAADPRSAQIGPVAPRVLIAAGRPAFHAENESPAPKDCFRCRSPPLLPIPCDQV